MYLPRGIGTFWNGSLGQTEDRATNATILGLSDAEVLQLQNLVWSVVSQDPMTGVPQL